jgi:hypothetical protein
MSRTSGSVIPSFLPRSASEQGAEVLFCPATHIRIVFRCLYKTDAEMTGKVAITIKNSKVVLTLIIYYLAVIVIGVLYLWNPFVIEAADSSFERNGDSSHHRTVSIVNDSGRTVEVYLISTTSSTTFTDGQSREEKLIETEWHSGEEVTLDSFVGDIFEIREKKVDKQGSVCDNLTIENEQDLACQLEQQAAVVTLTVREDDVEEQG